MARYLSFGSLLVAAATSLLEAQPLKGGGELRVNVATAGYQQLPAISAAPSGSFIVVWNSWPSDGDASGIVARRFESSGRAAGGEFQVNAWTTGYQGFPSVGTGLNDAFLVAWDLEGDGDDRGSYGRAFDEDGPLPAGEFRVNETTSGQQSFPSVAGSEDGGFVVAWSDSELDGSATGIMARRVDADGTPVGGEFQVNVWTTGFQTSPDVSADGTGNFVVVWQGPVGGGYGYGLFGRLFDSAGQPRGGEFRVDTFAGSTTFQPDVSMNTFGEFIVVWQGSYVENSGSDIFAQRFDSDGNRQGDEFQVNFTGTGYLQNPSVALDAFGSFAVAWESYGQDLSRYGVFGKVYIYPDQPVGDEYQVNTWTSGAQARPEVAAVGLGDFVTVWQSALQDGDGDGVFAQRHIIRAFCAAGDTDLDEVCDDFDSCPDVYNPAQEDANADGVGDHCDLALTAPADGSVLDCSNPELIRPTCTWTTGTYDAFKVFISPDPAFPKGSRVTSGDTWLRLPVWIPTKKKWKKACALAAASNPLAPVLYMRVLGKDRDLPERDPLRTFRSTPILVDITY